MPSYKAPLRDLRFVLHELLELGQYGDLPGFAEASPDIVDAMLEEAAKIAEDVLLPLNTIGDRDGCRLENGVVATPEGFKEAYKTFVDGGWIGLSSDPAFGGQGLPAVLSVAITELMSSANMAFWIYAGLTRGAASALLSHGSDALKARFLPKLVTGEWTGTMNLTEPHCGTDLGLIRTKAVPASDGSYAITGTKIFISAGEHDLTDNIIHLVLARIADAPQGVQGISLFVVPKFLVDDDGTLGARNKVSCGGLERKMGIHGNATCVLNYEGAKGFLVGEANKGLAAMFTMMNEARIGVGVQGLSQSEVAYQNAAVYAKERLQGRSVSGPKAPDQPADPIIVHADIRRLLMNARALNEGGRALLYYTALKDDIAERTGDAKIREAASDFLGLMTPVLKAYLTDAGFAACVDAQQVLGGHGYIAETGLEQFVRDARIAMIYEGANGIQALDLVGRKLTRDGGRALMAWFAEVEATLAEAAASEGLAPFLAGLTRAYADLKGATDFLMEHALADPEEATASATDYLHLFALTALAFIWVKIAKRALAKADTGDAFYANKLKTGRYFIDRVLPETAARLLRIRAGSASVAALDSAAF